MSRTERLLDLVQLLRRHRRPVSGRKLADELGVSIRTLYRDIVTLQGQGAPIEGEPGLGYVLKPGFMLPPLMFGEDEIEALLLGCHIQRAMRAARGRRRGKQRSTDGGGKKTQHGAACQADRCLVHRSLRGVLTGGGTMDQGARAWPIESLNGGR